MDKHVKYVLAIIVLCVFSKIAYAELFHSPLHGFSIEIPDDWSKRKPKKPWTLFVFAKLGSGENLNMNVLPARGLHSIKQVSLEQLMYPYYEHLKILQKSYETTNGTDFLKCIYKYNDGDLRKKLEGKYKLKHYCIQWIRGEKLYTLSFVDSEINFPRNIRRFIAVGNSIEFDN
jgi:hypothetical protein